MKKSFTISILCGIGLYSASIFISCNKPSQTITQERECYQVNPTLDTIPIKTHQYSVDSIVSLKIPDDTIEMRIEKISVVNGCAYIHDNIKNKIYIFDSKGNLKKIIGERGHARGEFLGMPDEFFVDNNNKLHVFDKIGHKIIIYNEEGSVNDVLETNDFYPHSFGLTSNNRYLMYFTDGYKDQYNNNKTETRYSLISLDEKCKEYKKLIPFEYEQHSFISEHTFSQNGDRLAFLPEYADSVIVFKGDSIEKVVSFDFGGKILCKENTEKLKQSEDFSFMDTYQGVLGITRFQETDSFVYLNYFFKDYKQYWLYNKRNGETFGGHQFLEGINPYSYFCIDKNQIIAFIKNETVKTFREYYHREAFQKNLKKSPDYMKDLMEGRIQAPALVYITLK